MKKLVLIPIIALFLSGAGLVATVASYPVNVNGERLDATVLNHNGTTYLPIRAVSESLGAPIEWTGSSVEIQTVDVEELKEACVAVLAQSPKDGMKGSGTYIDYDEILTAAHVVKGMDRFTVGGYIDLSLKDSDKDVDAAILETPHKKKPVKIGDSDEIKIGDTVIIVGTPQGQEEAVIYTTVKGLTNEIVVEGTADRGISGAGVFDVNGCLIGIAYKANINETFVVPINDIREAL